MLIFKPVIGPSLDVSTCGCVAPVNKNEKKNKIDGHRIIKYLNLCLHGCIEICR